MKTYSKILNDYSGVLTFSKGGYLKADCGRNWSCKDCIDAINSAILPNMEAQAPQHDFVKGKT